MSDSSDSERSEGTDVTGGVREWEKSDVEVVAQEAGVKFRPVRRKVVRGRILRRQ